MISQKPKGVHLVGSVPFENAERVFRVASEILGQRLRRIPDGETGERSNWINWQFGRVLAGNSALAVVEPAPGTYPPLPRVRLRPELSSKELTFGKLGYADAAKASYSVFVELKRAGIIAPQCRFQVGLPTPLALVTAFVLTESKADVESAYEAQMLAEVDEIAASIAHSELAIQWEAPVEIGILEGVWPAHFSDIKAGIIERLVRISSCVQNDIELGYHLCYGDNQHKHFKQPEDSAVLVDLANSISDSVKRPINWFHMPVPRERTDEAYFAPLSRLKLHPETELYLGLVHLTDGLEGTLKRIEAAQQVVSTFGVAAECGFGRRPPETVSTLLAIHAQATEV